MIKPSITEYIIDLDTEPWVGLKDWIFDGESTGDRYFENGVEFFFVVELRGDEAWCVWDDEHPPMWLMEKGDYFWSYDRTKIYLHCGNKIEDIRDWGEWDYVDDYDNPEDEEDDRWFKNNLTGGVATMTEVNAYLEGRL